jgi:hypothetical protein
MTFVFVCVVGARFLLPLLIPKFPLPAIVACLVLDGVDQTIFQSFGYDPPGYQGYDKAMDVYYLAVAYLATLRNWTSAPAFAVGRFLYFYRLVGVVAFELSHARPLLLVFPNTFEYFFIAYEAIRTRWSPLRLLMAGWVLVAALIWVVVKLPQEYWIHIAKLDVTDLLADHPWAGPVVGAVLVALLGVAWRVGRPRTPAPDWPWRWAAGPLPEQIDEGHEVAAWHVEHGRVWSWPTLEKVALVSLLSVVFAQTLPGVRSTDLELAVGTGILVVVNASISLAASRRSVSFESLVVAFGVRMLVNIGLVLLASWLLGGASVNEGATVFFLFLLSLLTTMHDRWLPIRQVRDAAGPGGTPTHLPSPGAGA